MDARTQKSFVPPSLRYSFIALVIGAAILSTGCASSPKERMESELRDTFHELQTAIQNGELKSLQKIWISPDGTSFSIETLSKFYEQGRNQLIGKFQNAKIESAPAIFNPTPSIQKRFPKAQYAGTLQVRNSYGTPRPYQAVYIDGTWRLIQRINLQQQSSNNDTKK